MVGARCRARVICRGGYESAECPSGCNIILNDDIGGARGTAETASRSLHVRGNARNENHGAACACVLRVCVCVHVCVYMVVSAHVRRLEVSSSSSLSSLSPTNGSLPSNPVASSRRIPVAYFEIRHVASFDRLSSQLSKKCPITKRVSPSYYFYFQNSSSIFFS